MEPKEIFKPYAQSAFELMKIYKEIESKFKIEKDPLSKNILKKQQQTIKHLIDRSVRVTGDFVPVSISKKAKQYCDVNQLGDIFEIGWNEQAKFERQKNRKTCKLKHEHKIPVNEQIAKIMKSNTLDQVLEIFMNQEIVWVTKEEDKKLPKSNRPDSDKAYKDAEIEIIRNTNKAGHLFKSKTNNSHS